MQELLAFEGTLLLFGVTGNCTGTVGAGNCVGAGDCVVITGAGICVGADNCTGAGIQGLFHLPHASGHSSPSFKLRHTKQNSVLQVGHPMCLQFSLCSIPVLHLGHSRYDGHSTLPIIFTGALSNSSASIPQSAFPQSV